jgi:hypothetical protein
MVDSRPARATQWDPVSIKNKITTTKRLNISKFMRFKA